MAQKVIAVSLQADGQQAQKTVIDLQQKLKAANQELQQSQKNFGILSDEAKAAALKVADLKTQLSDANKNLKNSTETVQTLKAAIKEATANLQQAQKEFGNYSKEALNAAKALADLKDQQKEAAETAALFDPGTKLQAFTNVAKTAAGGLSAFTGLLALAGTESEDLQKSLVKVQAAMAFSEGISTIADSAKDFERLGAIIQSTTVYRKLDTAATVVATFTQNLFSVAVDTTSASFKALKVAIAATGIGLLVIAIVAVVNALNEASKAADEAAKKQKAYNDLQQEAAGSAKEAYTQIQKLKQEFKDAGNNVALQKKAMEDFNSTVGDSTKQIKSFSEGQSFLADDKQTQAYVEAMLARATATAAIGKAADANITILQQDAVIKERLDFYRKQYANLAGKTDAQILAEFNSSFQKQAGTTTKEIGDKIIDDAITARTAAQKTLDDFNGYATKSSKEAEDITKAHGWGTGTKYQVDEMAKQLDEALKKQLDANKRWEDQAVASATLANADEQDITDIHLKAANARVSILQNYVKNAAGINADAYKAAKDALQAAVDDQNKIKNDADIARSNFLKGLMEKRKAEGYGQVLGAGDISEINRDNANLHNPAPDQLKGGIGATGAGDKIAAQQQAVKDAQDKANSLTSISGIAGDVVDYKTQLDNLTEFYDKQLAVVDRGSEEEMKILKAQAEAKKQLQLNTAKSILNDAADMLGKQTAAGKAAAIAATTIDTYQSATAAFKAMAGIPVIGPALGAVAAGLAIASGIKNVKAILATKTPGPDVSGGASISVAAPVVPTVIPQATSTTLNQDQVNQIGNAAVKTFVLESDVANNQERVTRLNRAARLT